MQHDHKKNKALYRPCVGIMLINKNGHVFIAERIGFANSWQMPQGGIDEGEDPETAVFREMEEEIGTKNARIIGSIDEWLYYDFPPHKIHLIMGGKYHGQKQKWIALKFLGDDSDIRLDAHDVPEFSQWKWVPLSELLDYAVSFKRDVYARVIHEFKELVE